MAFASRATFDAPPTTIFFFFGRARTRSFPSHVDRREDSLGLCVFFGRIRRDRGAECAVPARPSSFVLSFVLHESNALDQLAPKDPRKPPVVFHYVPIIGCAVSYGMDPYGFMFRCREKVRSFCLRALGTSKELTHSIIVRQRLYFPSHRKDCHCHARSARKQLRPERQTGSRQC